MIFNGHTAESIENIDEETFTEITVMWADGMLGGRGMFEAMAPVTAAVFNFMRNSSTAPFTTDKIFPWIREYILNPDLEPTAQEKTSQALLAYMSMAPGFSMERFKNVGSSKRES